MNMSGVTFGRDYGKLQALQTDLHDKTVAFHQARVDALDERIAQLKLQIGEHEALHGESALNPVVEQELNPPTTNMSLADTTNLPDAPALERRLTTTENSVVSTPAPGMKLAVRSAGRQSVTYRA